eukprot:COSAG02_NODE_293_length_25438_cov_52.630254_22_plen_186_part_00
MLSSTCCSRPVCRGVLCAVLVLCCVLLLLLLVVVCSWWSFRCELQNPQGGVAAGLLSVGGCVRVANGTSIRGRRNCRGARAHRTVTRRIIYNYGNMWSKAMHFRLIAFVVWKYRGSPCYLLAVSTRKSYRLTGGARRPRMPNAMTRIVGHRAPRARGIALWGARRNPLILDCDSLSNRAYSESNT